MARESTAALITRLRTMVGDPLGDSQTFSDDELEAFLDARRTDMVAQRIRGRGSVTNINLVEYVADQGYWEDDVVLDDSLGAVLTPDVSDVTAGRWAFTSGFRSAVYIIGSFFDLYGAAQSVLEAWAARVATEFDFATDQQTFSRSQKREGLLVVAREYARRAIGHWRFV